MAYDETVADRVRTILNNNKTVSEKKMFGGLSFLINGNMCCGVINDMLMVRTGPDQYEKALEKPHARSMDFTGKPLKGFVYVDKKGFAADNDLQEWINLGVSYASSLPKKERM